MARLNVNSTRMVLRSLKNKLKVAIHGHKLMKDKRDELMRNFMDVARENVRLRKEVEKSLMEVYKNVGVAAAVMSPAVMDGALMCPKRTVELEIGTRNVMSVEVPVFNFDRHAADTETVYPYGFADTSGELDSVIENLNEVFFTMLELAAIEKKTAMLANEIEQTRRRVNALEYVKIPQYQETIKYISMKLSENERGNQTRLMKVKDKLVEDQIRQRRLHDEEAARKFAEISGA